VRRLQGSELAGGLLGGLLCGLAGCGQCRGGALCVVPGGGDRGIALAGGCVPGGRRQLGLTLSGLGAGQGGLALAGQPVSTPLLPAVLLYLRTSLPPFRAAGIQVARTSASQSVLRIEFAAPSPFGLLSQLAAK